MLILNSQCTAQTSVTVNPKLVVSFKLGQKNFFEKDLKYIKEILDNENYTVNNYSFLPKMIFSVGNEVWMYDRFSGNVVVYDLAKGQAENKSAISEQLKKSVDLRRQSIDLIGISGNLLLFYDYLSKTSITFDKNSGATICEAVVPNPMAIDLIAATDTVVIYAYKANYKFLKCKETKVHSNKNIRVNDDNVFIRYNEFLFYQTMQNKSIRRVLLDNTILKIQNLKLDKVADLTNYSLVHVNSKFYVFSSDLERGLGQFLFVDKVSGKTFKKVIIDPTVVSNSLVDINNAISNFPSPDVDDSAAYIRMTSIGSQYFIMFQSRGHLNIHVFEI
jgi:hypothetical protein